MDPYVAAWIRALALTLVVEVPVFVLVGRAARAGVPLPRLAIAGTVGTLVSHPVLWFVWPHLFSDYATFIVTGELAVAAFESVTFCLVARPVPLVFAVAASFLANGASYGAGVLLRAARIF